MLHALYELLRGVQAADDASDHELLREALAERPDDVYHALLTVILRLAFLLYAEECDLLPEGETFARHYSLAGLYERLREDAALQESGSSADGNSTAVKESGLTQPLRRASLGIVPSRSHRTLSVC